jgi:hypothetical protein
LINKKKSCILKVACYLDPETHDFLNDEELKKVESYLKKEYSFTGNTPDEFYIEDDSNINVSNSALKKFSSDLGKILNIFLNIFLKQFFINLRR